MKSRLLFFQKSFTCAKCPTSLRKYGVKGIAIPTPRGWVEKSLDEAEGEATEIKGARYDHRKAITIGNYSVELAIERLCRK